MNEFLSGKVYLFFIYALPSSFKPLKFKEVIFDLKPYTFNLSPVFIERRFYRV
jgi:hypothetical protein